jgi:hypothetical protein
MPEHASARQCTPEHEIAGQSTPVHARARQCKTKSFRKTHITALEFFKIIQVI